MATWDENIENGLKSGYFNSIESDGTYDRPYNADDMTNYFEGLVSSGVYKGIGDELEVTAGDGLQVVVATGRAMLDCRWMRVTKPQIISLTTADTLAARTDLIVAELNYNTRQFQITVLEGTDVVPDDTDTIKYLSLASASIPANATTVTVTDLRNSERCGYVQALATPAIFNQERVAREAHVRYTLPANLATHSIPFANFDASTDTLEVYVNGIRLLNTTGMSEILTTVSNAVPPSYSIYTDSNGTAWVNFNDTLHIPGEYSYSDASGNATTTDVIPQLIEFVLIRGESETA